MEERNMETSKTVFSQLLDFVPKRQFRRCVERYNGDHRVRTFSCWDQFLCMAFAKLTYRESLRDIEICLRNRTEQLYRIGLRGNVSRSTLADANESRDSRIYADLCQLLIQQARTLYADEKFIKELDEVVYILDSTYISLCLSLFPWAKFSPYKAAVKVHTLLDLRGAIPAFIAISRAKYRDNEMLDNILIEPGAFYVMDKAYIDFARLYNIDQARAYFVTRSKKNLRFRRQYSRPVDKESGVRADQTIKLVGRVASGKYPNQLRRIRYFNEQNKIRLTFLTNNFNLSAETIADLYKARWQIEVFFKWIKQNLRITSFYGTSFNAVRTQIWIAISTYLLVAIVKKQLNIKTPLYQILQFLSLSLFDETPILRAFTPSHQSNFDPPANNQLNLFTS